MMSLSNSRAKESSSEEVKSDAQVDQQMGTLFPLDDFKKVMLSAYDKISPACDRDLVLFLGGTGAGKSTAANYVLGCEMEERFDDSSLEPYPYPKPGEKIYAKIGRGSESKTLYPEVFAVPGQSFAFADFPGFGDTRGSNVETATAVTTRIAIQVANSIKAIFIIISFGELTTQRGKGLLDVFNAIGNLFNDKKAGDSILFVITKTNPTLTREHILNYVRRLRDEKNRLYTDQIERLEQQKGEAPLFLKEDIEVLAKQIAILTIMSQSIDKLHILHPYSAVSRNEIMRYLTNTPSIPKNEFELSNRDQTFHEFNNLIHNIVIAGQRVIQDYLELTKENAEVVGKLEKLKNQVANKRVQLGIIRDNKEPVELLNEQNLENINELVQQRIQYLQQKDQIKNLINRLNLELKQLDSAEEVCYLERKIQTNRPRTMTLTLSSMVIPTILPIVPRAVIDNAIQNKIHISYRGVPFIRVEKQTSSGVFLDEITQPADGVYECTHQSKRIDTVGFVKIYVKKCNLPDNQQRIQDLKQGITDAIEKHKAIKIKLSSLDDQLTFLDRESKDITQKKIKKEIIAPRLEQEIAEFEKQTKEVDTLHTAQCFCLAQLEDTITSKAAEYKMVANFNELLKFDSALITAFVENYKKLPKRLLELNQGEDITSQRLRHSAAAITSSSSPSLYAASSGSHAVDRSDLLPGVAPSLPR